MMRLCKVPVWFATATRRAFLSSFGGARFWLFFCDELEPCTHCGDHSASNPQRAGLQIMATQPHYEVAACFMHNSVLPAAPDLLAQHRRGYVLALIIAVRGHVDALDPCAHFENHSVSNPQRASLPSLATPPHYEVTTHLLHPRFSLKIL